MLTMKYIADEDWEKPESEDGVGNDEDDSNDVVSCSS